tara:strand:- start:630 stop:1502 length:873 start_codon:yes stop_codon:yes gene_type:complete
MRVYLPFIIFLTLSSCSKIPVPSILAPEENKSIQKVSFGKEPLNYQSILKNYLIANLNNYQTAKVEFINKPSKISIDHLGDNYSGYRVCLSINEKRGEYYIGYKNHFFLINNSQIDLHLYDSGLLTIPFEYCVSRNINNEYFIDDIPEKSVDAMDSVKLNSEESISYKKLQKELKKLKIENKKLKKLDTNIKDLAKIDTPKEIINNKDNVYISCIFENMSMTYVFNANKETFKLINKLDIIPYVVSFNDAYIVATNEELELTINRVTGKAALENKALRKGMCSLTNKTKF